MSSGLRACFLQILQPLSLKPVSGSLNGGDRGSMDAESTADFAAQSGLSPSTLQHRGFWFEGFCCSLEGRICLWVWHTR